MTKKHALDLELALNALGVELSNTTTEPGVYLLELDPNQDLPEGVTELLAEYGFTAEKTDRVMTYATVLSTFTFGTIQHAGKGWFIKRSPSSA